MLDVMCGYGRHSLEMARRGYNVLAIDNAKDYVDEINVLATQEALPVKAVAEGILEAALQGLYKAAICMGNSFAFFNKADTILLLKKIADHLQPGGILVINSYMIAEIAYKHFKQREWNQYGDYKYLIYYTFHFHPNRVESEHTIITPDGTLEVIKGIDYIFSINELEEMFALSGFRLKEIFSTPKKRKFHLGDGMSYLVVEKNL